MLIYTIPTGVKLFRTWATQGKLWQYDQVQLKQQEHRQNWWQEWRTYSAQAHTQSRCLKPSFLPQTKTHEIFRNIIDKLTLTEATHLCFVPRSHAIGAARLVRGSHEGSKRNNYPNLRIKLLKVQKLMVHCRFSIIIQLQRIVTVSSSLPSGIYPLSSSSPESKKENIR